MADEKWICSYLCNRHRSTKKKSVALRRTSITAEITNDVVQQKKKRNMGVPSDFAQSIADHVTDSLPNCPECLLKLNKRKKYVYRKNTFLEKQKKILPSCWKDDNEISNMLVSLFWGKTWRLM